MRVASVVLLLLPSVVAGCTGDEDERIRLRYNGLAFAEDECGPPVNATAYFFAPREDFDAVLVEIAVDGERVVTEIDDLDASTAARPTLVFEELDLCDAPGKRHVEVRATVAGVALVEQEADVNIPRARVVVARMDGGPGPCGTEGEGTPVVVHVWNSAQHAAGRTHVIVDSIDGTWEGWLDRIPPQDTETVDALAYPRPSCGEGATAPICVSAKADNGPAAFVLGQLTRRGTSWIAGDLDPVQTPCYSHVALEED